jgi:hypothetical protein
MSAMTLDLPSLHSATKLFSSPPDWVKRDKDNVVLIAPLEIDGVTVAGLQFRATILRTRPDECVTFQLEYFPPRGTPKGGPIARIEWRPLRPHNNKMIGPKELQNVLQTGTHHHQFEMNWRHNKSLVNKGILKLSCPIEPEPSYDELLAFTGKEFRIQNIDLTPVPPWEGSLF